MCLYRVLLQLLLSWLDNLYSIIMKSQTLLTGSSNVLLLMLFLYNPDKVSKACKENGNCNKELECIIIHSFNRWKSIPRNYSQLLSSFNKQIIPFDTPMHVMNDECIND